MTSKKNSLKRKVTDFDNEFTNDLNFAPWVEKFFPSSLEELAVHKKKVSEVQTWIQNALSPKKNSQDSSVLLLTGPPGVGKTTTVHTICNRMGVEIFSWSNNNQNKTMKATDEILLNQKSGTVRSETQAVAFNRFLLQSAKYSLFSNSKKIIVVEEFPNAFFKDPSAFHTILRKYTASYQCPAVFIMSDSVKGQNFQNNLFPKDLQLTLRINNISFNPIAPTMLLKVLTRINNSSKVQAAYKQLNKAELEGIASDSMGDIRNAINSMQFLSMTKFKKPQPIKNIAKNSSSKRDSNVFLFHALGKILYSKRNPDLNCERDVLSNKLKHFERDPLISQPEGVFDRTSISAEGFVLFLQENYLSFLDDIVNTSECSSWLSEADFLSSFWNNQETMKDYMVSLAARGLMFNLTPSISNKKWRPLHKPQFYEYNTKHKQLSYALEHNFKGAYLSLRELQIDFVPFLSKIRPKDLKLAQLMLLKDVGEMDVKKYGRDRAKTLDEKDCFDLDSEETDLIPTEAYQTENISYSIPEDEEIVIDEYDF